MLILFFQEEKYFPTFRKSQLYFKLLRELNLLTENKTDSHTESDTTNDCSCSPQLIKVRLIKNLVRVYYFYSYFPFFLFIFFKYRNQLVKIN